MLERSDTMNKKILIVEDESAISDIIANGLRADGCTVFQEKNGKDGLAAAIQEQPHLILLDIVMPLMDGLSMLRELRKDEWGKDAQVMLLTNLSDMGKIEEATKLGVYEYLVKSDWELKDVIEKIGEKLSLISD